MEEHKYFFKPLIETEVYHYGDLVKCNKMYLTIIKECTGKDLLDETKWGDLCLATFSLGDPGPQGDPGVYHDCSNDDTCLETGFTNGSVFDIPENYQSSNKVVVIDEREYEPLMFDEFKIGTIDIK